MIRRPPRSTLSSSSAASDVYKRQGGSRVMGKGQMTAVEILEEMRTGTYGDITHFEQSGVPEEKHVKRVLEDLWNSGMLQKEHRLARVYQYWINDSMQILSLIHISEPTRLLSISYAVFCLKKKKNHQHI
eukprot:TRINITY_DN39603_c0_g1_i1.p1 TRINITY_DN39603_c0_g1~~TRINITY_DN39603_c0_g1_i1.p1  ORF type:complete len:130 (+),score=43.24 TRINITY_DN39603_c0_g1_i1:84-473(+)